LPDWRVAFKEGKRSLFHSLAASGIPDELNGLNCPESELFFLLSSPENTSFPVMTLDVFHQTRRRYCKSRRKMLEHIGKDVRKAMI
jgi:hypothetical protein